MSVSLSDNIQSRKSCDNKSASKQSAKMQYSLSFVSDALDSEGLTITGLKGACCIIPKQATTWDEALSSHSCKLQQLLLKGLFFLLLG